MNQGIMLMNRLLFVLLCTLSFALPASAHDSWVQTNTNLIRTGDAIHIDLMLGNHGNEHRDFKLAGKVDLAAATLDIIAPDGKSYDIKPKLTDQGYEPGTGYWTASFICKAPGLYMVAHTYDKVVSYAPERSVKSSKTFFLVSQSLDSPPMDGKGFDRVMGYPLELVALDNPVTPMGPGQPLRVKLLLHGQPLANTRVSFIPRGVELRKDFDTRYERKTDEKGIAEFEPNQANSYLIVAHYLDESAGGKNYKSTKYSATMTLFVPAICPCCGE
jgi:uncharacterized GH25 family protein